MVDLVERAESHVKSYILFVLYEITSRYKRGYGQNNPLNMDLKVIIEGLDKENRSEEISKWIDDFEQQV